MTSNPTGQQYTIASGRYRAVVTEVGATLRSLSVDGEELLWTFGAAEAPRGSQGRQLVPWPNRIKDGRYRFDGVDYQLPITEVPRHNAIHGLAEGAAWESVRHSPNEVVLGHTLYPQHGWDAVLRTEVTHRVDDDGLHVHVETRNVGSSRAPYGYGAHPYLALDVARAELSFSFTQELVVDPERLLPIKVVPLTPEHDFRSPRPIGNAQFDTALTGCSGDWWVTVARAGRSVTFWGDESLAWGQIFTPPGREAIAVEPMTCGPDAFNEGPTHGDLIVLEPGEVTRSVWGIRISAH